ncbi:MAG: IS110 family transposase, partial [Enterocloster clostridioformis]|nr:IS110 family transposase [Enterocloster clostridioformis]MDY4764178.1 IS110 family transposase [Enterocloster clostridioformis]MDY4764780.1 IS110 family transposase [Enterocloster clostridioformis]
MSFKIFRFNCCGLDVHKTWIYACIGITDSNGRTDYKQARFSSFS